MQNFRSIKDLTVDLGETTVFIGQNNTGKPRSLTLCALCSRDGGDCAELASRKTTFTALTPIAIPALSLPSRSR